MNKNSVFIFGASGFLGDALTKHLNGIKTNVKRVGRNHGDIYYDLSKSAPEMLTKVVNAGDTWVHLAGVTSPELCERHPDRSYEINVKNSQRLIRWLIEREVKVIYASSDVVFGNLTRAASDTDKPHPVGHYAVQKALMETFVSENELVKVVRLSYVFGENDKFSELIRNAFKTKETLNVYSGFYRCVVKLEDVIVGVQRLIESWDSYDFRVVNFCGPELVDRVEIAEFLQSSLFPDVDLVISKAPESFWRGRVKSINLECANFTKLLGRRPERFNSRQRKNLL